MFIGLKRTSLVFSSGLTWVILPWGLVLVVLNYLYSVRNSCLWILNVSLPYYDGKYLFWEYGLTCIPCLIRFCSHQLIWIEQSLCFYKYLCFKILILRTLWCLLFRYICISLQLYACMMICCSFLSFSFILLFVAGPISMWKVLSCSL